MVCACILTNVLAQSDSESLEEGGNSPPPKRVFMPVRPSASPMPLQVVTVPKKQKIDPVNALEARARAIAQCKTPLEFVRNIIYDGLPATILTHVTMPSPLRASWRSGNAPKSELQDFILARRLLADTALKYWTSELFHIALPISVSLVGASHTTLANNYGVNDTDKRSFWFMCFVLAALHTEAMGVGREHSFVLEVWRMTMKDFMLPCQERDGRSGGRKTVKVLGILSCHLFSCFRCAAHASKHFG